jgi:hypothetical protein
MIARSCISRTATACGLLKLVNTLLGFSRIEAGAVVLRQPEHLSDDTWVASPLAGEPVRPSTMIIRRGFRPSRARGPIASISAGHWPHRERYDRDRPLRTELMIDAPIETPTSVIAPWTSAEDRLEGLMEYLTAHRLRVSIPITPSFETSAGAAAVRTKTRPM